jgi:hypothetical protein
MARRPARCYRYCKNKVSIFCFDVPSEGYSHTISGGGKRAKSRQEMGKRRAGNARMDRKEAEFAAGICFAIF